MAGGRGIVHSVPARAQAIPKGKEGGRVNGSLVRQAAQFDITVTGSTPGNTYRKLSLAGCGSGVRVALWFRHCTDRGTYKSIFEVRTPARPRKA